MCCVRASARARMRAAEEGVVLTHQDGVPRGVEAWGAELLLPHLVEERVIYRGDTSKVEVIAGKARRESRVSCEM